MFNIRVFLAIGIATFFSGTKVQAQPASVNGFATSTEVERMYVGIFAPTESEALYRAPRDRTRFFAEASQLLVDGFRLDEVEVYQAPAGLRYIGVWRPGSGDNFIEGPMGVTDFRRAREMRFEKGQRLVDFEFHRNAGQRFTGLWRNGTGDERLSGSLEIDAFLARGASLAAEGLRLIDHDVEVVNGVQLFRGLWREGTGSNTFVAPRSRKKFIKERDNLAETGQVLVDVEMIEKDGAFLYSGVFRSGPGVPSNTVLSLPRSQGDFGLVVKKQLAAGRKLLDVEVVNRPKPKPDPGQGGPNLPPTGTGSLPLPEWVDFTDQPRIVIDFTQHTDAGFRITLPLKYVKNLPEIGGEIAVPDQMCGLKVRNFIRFDWTENGQPVKDDPLFNAVPEDNPNTPIDEESKFFSSEDMLGGISFSGPIGACSGDSQWFFPSPFTGTDSGFTAPQREMVLTIALAGNSEIEFLDSSKPKGKPLDYDKLFKEVNFREKINKIVKDFKDSKDEKGSGICGIVDYLLKTCESSPGGIDCLHAMEVIDTANCD